MTTAQPTTSAGPRTAIRWRVCALLLMSTTIVYLNRTTISVLKHGLQNQLHFGDAEYGWLQFSFQTAYAIMFVLAGRFVDWVGAKIGLAVGVVFWSLATIAGGLCRTWEALAATQFFLGCGASVNFPASFKAITEWFPQQERALAAGIFNSGSNLGIMMAVVAAWAAVHLGWPWAFYIVGATGFVWLILWLPGYFSLQSHPTVSPAELAYIRAGQPPLIQRTKFHWTEILRYRQAWPFLIAKFLTDPVWWFYSGWLPDYLQRTRGLSLVGSAGWLSMPYIAADIGSICGGWLSGSLIKRGFAVGPARYIAMGICALGMPGAIIAVYTNNFPLALALISLATACHQGWSANLFTTAIDLFPSSVAGSIIGLGGMTGAVGGMIMTLLVGTTLASMHTYVPAFVGAGIMHPLAWLIFLAVAGPKMLPAQMRPEADHGLARRLLVAGLIIAALGGIRIAYVLTYWHGYATSTIAAGAMVAASVVAAIGVGLVYASLPRPRIAGDET